MKAENITTGVWFGESWEETTEEHSNCLHLSNLSRVEIKRDGKSIDWETRTKFFLNPPTERVQMMRDILSIIGLGVIPRKDFRSSGKVTVVSTPSIQLEQTESGFRSEWLILLEGVKFGSIEECGNFWDRSADIIIDIPSL